MDLSLPQIWLIVGLVMLFFELISVMLVFVFFAIGALITALLASLGVIPDLQMQLLTFSIVSMGSMIFLRKYAQGLLVNKDKSQEYNEFVGETAMVIRDIPARGEGKLYYRGAEWKAVSIDHTEIIAGSKVLIKKADGIVLIVKESR
jgi:membrane protein implicated in regulation of membrane protease activity